MRGSNMLLPNFYCVNLRHSSWKHVFSIRVGNTVDSDHCDQMASSEASSELIWIYSIFKKEQIRVQQDKG